MTSDNGNYGKSRANHTAKPARARLIRISLSLLGLVAVIGPWPYLQGPGGFTSTIEPTDRSPRSFDPSGIFQAGWAEAAIESAEDRPLAGFIGRISTVAACSPSPCRVKAISVGDGSSACTVVCVDLLLVDRMMSREIVREAGLRPRDVYFTATHTHSGFGGWANHPLERLVAGTYDRAFRDEICETIAQTIVRSRAQMRPSELALVEVDAPGVQVNRIDRKSPTNNRLSALAFRHVSAEASAPPGAILATFGTHATIENGNPPRLDGDYPAELSARLRDRTGADLVGFAAGTVGDSSPVRLDPKSQPKSASLLGESLAAKLADAIKAARYERSIAFESLTSRVKLPPPAVMIGSPFVRFSPVATWWVGGRSTSVSALRIGPAVLVGFPGDYAGHLRPALVAGLEGGGMRVIPTSFNGDYVGYLVSEQVFWDHPSYETRSMNFYGPRIGEGLNQAGRSLIDELSR